MASNCTTLWSGDVKTYANMTLPRFKKPNEIGHFSIQPNDTTTFDRSQLKRLNEHSYLQKIPTSQTQDAFQDLLAISHGSPPTPLINLSDGYASWRIPEENTKVFMEPLLRWILHNRQRIMIGQPTNTPGPTLRECCGDADFVCMRGVLALIAKTLYFQHLGWTLNVVRFGDVCFLVKVKKAAVWMPEGDTELRRAYCGYKFEQLMTTDEHNQATHVDTTCAQYYSVTESSIESVANSAQPHNLLCAGEVDCVGPDGEHREIKVYNIAQTSIERAKLSTKLITPWIQCTLLGIPKLVIGFRNDDYYLQGVYEMSTDDIVPLAAANSSAASSRYPWQPTTGLNMLERVLTALRSHTENDYRAIYEMKYEPAGKYTSPFNPPKVSIRKLDDSESLADESFAFLRENFVGYFR